MKFRTAGLLVCLISPFGACNRNAEEPPQDDIPGASREYDRTLDTMTLVMPPIPETAGRGFVFTSTGRQKDYIMSKENGAQAFLCLDPPLLYVQSIGELYGIIALVQLTEEQPQAQYPLEPGAVEIPDPNTARVAFQIYETRGSEKVFRVLEGSLSIEAFSDSVSGAFSGLFQESSYRDSVLASGRFQALVQPGSEEACQIATRRAPPSMGFGN